MDNNSAGMLFLLVFFPPWLSLGGGGGDWGPCAACCSGAQCSAVAPRTALLWQGNGEGSVPTGWAVSSCLDWTPLEWVGRGVQGGLCPECGRLRPPD